MLRKAATTVSLGAVGFMVEGLEKVDATGNESYVYLMEKTEDGTNHEVTAKDVKFLDGSPASLEAIE